MSKSIVIRLAMVAVAGFVALHSVGCNTTEGAGQDLKNAGSGIERAADRNK